MRAAYLDGGRPLGRIRTLMRCVDGCSSFVVVPMVIADGILRDRIVTAADRYDAPVTPGALADTDALTDLITLRAGSAPRRHRTGHPDRPDRPDDAETLPDPRTHPLGGHTRLRR